MGIRRSTLATGLWISVAGASAQAKMMDLMANHLANVNTPGFKKDMAVFQSYFLEEEKKGMSSAVPAVPMRDEEFYFLEGRDQAYVVMEGIYPSFQAGGLRATDKNLDLALEGDGFFEISTPHGIFYTRCGNFKKGPDGRLLTSQGDPVLAIGALHSWIDLKNDFGPIQVNAKGEIFSGEDRVAQLSIVEFKDLNQLEKVGNQYFRNKNAENIFSSSKTIVHQGMIESSNVNPIEEMSQLILAHRMFEYQLKSLKTYEALMAKEANEIGRLR